MTALRLAAGLLLALASIAPGADERSIILATTTSTQDSGLLDVLVPEFRTQSGITVKVIAVGSGAALEMAARGDCDAVLAHSPAAERRAVDAGHLVGGRAVMHNDFVLVGPAADPAHVRGSADVTAAMKAIAASGQFVSRGDDSGTHKMELDLWKQAGVDPASLKKRTETGQGMGATLHVADQRSAYTLADRGTWLALQKTLGLKLVFEGGSGLLNPYHVYVVNPAKHAGVKEKQAQAFVDFLVAPATQATIGNFRKRELGQSLFIPDAGKESATP